ncbi:L-histidine N(alpha)-methyltransferase [Methanosarcina horonobensis]|uniref:L-histidine N(alpha)-methyltransferase n=1 Tax=Methanosarcina horonobensis TaxID=418008 RepID=UPI000B1F386B|nr:L-histidine N(alpha)-methyltransferase [Methanosarcina horonobensis]
MSLVSVGVGSGEKERILLEELIKKNLAERPASEKVPIIYYPVDINSQLVDLALEKARDLPVEKKGIVGFIEDMPLLKEHWRLPVLFSILGNTFCNYEPEFILKLVYENLEQGDLFFL